MEQQNRKIIKTNFAKIMQYNLYFESFWINSRINFALLKPKKI